MKRPPAPLDLTRLKVYPLAQADTPRPRSRVSLSRPSHIADAPVAETERVFSFCEDIGLPTTLADIGLGNAGREKLMLAAEKTCAKEQPVHHEAGVITPEKVDKVLDELK